ncbi:MAG: hypothetical protein AAF658_00185 [Myxococcota bacterium]
MQSLITLDFVAGVALLLTIYWIADVLIRREHLVDFAKRLKIPHRVVTAILVLAGLGAMPFLPWPAHPLLIIGSTLATVMAWKSGSDDIDVGHGRAWWYERAVLLLSGIAVWWSPALVPAQLHVTTRPFIGWKHHGHLPLRVVQLSFSYAVLARFAPAISVQVGLEVFIFVAMMMLGSHYVITAFAKGMLGPRWYSWMTDNRLHNVAASAYVWGWARFIPRRRWSQLLAIIAPLNVPMQIGAFALEAASPLVLTSPTVAVVLAVTAGVFHLVVYITTGILFWEWALTNVLLAWFILQLAPEVTAQAFGLVPFIAGTVLLFVFPLRGRLWHPDPLGWWDTGLTQRVQWRVIGESGTVYDLHNDFMCPHERNYGRVHGCFLIEKRVFTYHLGEVWRIDLRDEIRTLRDHPERLEEIRERFGISVHEPQQSERHLRYLQRFLQALNRGERKFVFPRGLRWLKAPGGQFYYWGDRPSFRGQEKAVAFQIWFFEEYWDGEVHHKFEESLLREVSVIGEEQEACEELDERVVDAMVLQRAVGTLVNVPDRMVARARTLYPENKDSRSLLDLAS